MIGAVKMGVCAIYFLTAASELALHVTPGTAGDETQGVQPLLGLLPLKQRSHFNLKFF